MPRIPDPPARFDTRKAIKLYRELGSYAAVARELGVKKETAAKYLKREGLRRVVHGTHDPRIRGLYRTWCGMRRRCRNPWDALYELYGRRGIGYVPRWERFEAFRDWAFAHGWKEGLVLYRRDRAQDFSPRNCRWVTPSEQRRGRTGQAARLLRAFGKEQSIMLWARDARCSVTERSLRVRIRKGWSAADAIGLPAGAEPSRRVGPDRYRVRPRRRIDWEKVERLVLKRGLNMAEAARRMGLSKETVANHFRARGISPGRSDSGLRLRFPSLYALWTTIRANARHAKPGRRRPRIARGWDAFEGFAAWARSAGYRRRLCLVRVDPDGDYTPENCRFVPKKHVVRFQRPPRETGGRAYWLLTAWGESKGPTAWSRDPRCQVTLASLLKRLRRGWRPEEAIDTPPQWSFEENPNQVLIQAFGRTKNLVDWSRDPRCKVGKEGLRMRLKKGIPPEEAITSPPWTLGRGDPGPGGRGRGRSRGARRHPGE